MRWAGSRESVGRGHQCVMSVSSGGGQQVSVGVVKTQCVGRGTRYASCTRPRVGEWTPMSNDVDVSALTRHAHVSVRAPIHIGPNIVISATRPGLPAPYPSGDAGICLTELIPRLLNTSPAPIHHLQTRRGARAAAKHTHGRGARAGSEVAERASRTRQQVLWGLKWVRIPRRCVSNMLVSCTMV